jgi:hypothetical protein
VNRKHKQQLEFLRRGQTEATEHVAKSQEAIEDSLTLLRGTDGTEVARKPGTRCAQPEGQGLDRIAR